MRSHADFYDGWVGYPIRVCSECGKRWPCHDYLWAKPKPPVPVPEAGV